MNIEEFRLYCLAKPGTSEDLPFDENTLVFKVAGKMFALTDITQFDGVNLKCDPERAIDLRERFHGIQPGYHMSKVHWNTVKINSDVSDKFLFELVDHSYELVVSKLSKKERKVLGV